MQLWPGTYSSAFAVVASDATPITCRAIYVGVTGNVTVTLAPGATPVLFTAVPAGTTIPVQIEQGRINATGTTATGLVALA